MDTSAAHRPAASEDRTGNEVSERSETGSIRISPRTARPDTESIEKRRSRWRNLEEGARVAFHFELASNGNAPAISNAKAAWQVGKNVLESLSGFGEAVDQTKVNDRAA